MTRTLNPDLKVRRRSWSSIVAALLLAGACGVLVVRGLVAAALQKMLEIKGR